MFGLRGRGIIDGGLEGSTVARRLLYRLGRQDDQTQRHPGVKLGLHNQLVGVVVADEQRIRHRVGIGHPQIVSM